MARLLLPIDRLDRPVSQQQNIHHLPAFRIAKAFDNRQNLITIARFGFGVAGRGLVGPDRTGKSSVQTPPP